MQWQCVVPDAARDLVRAVAVDPRRAAAVHPRSSWSSASAQPTPHPLSFPRSGWTVAADLPASASGLGRLLDQLDEQIADVGGRVYLAKDARLAPTVVERMYPDLDGWRKARHELDPREVFVSDLSRRLGLT